MEWGGGGQGLMGYGIGGSSELVSERIATYTRIWGGRDYGGYGIS